MPRSLVLCPTRELAAQVAENFDTYAKYVKLTKALLIGGVSFKEQDALIDKGVDVLIATPGRLLDHFERGKLILTDVKVMVVDEADRMLDMGFIPDIERIFGLCPSPARRCSSPPPWRPRSSGSPTPSCRTPSGSRSRARPRRPRRSNRA
jgi:superfamily II DNA/RNA helicase